MKNILRNIVVKTKHRPVFCFECYESVGDGHVVALVGADAHAEFWLCLKCAEIAVEAMRQKSQKEAVYHAL